MQENLKPREILTHQLYIYIYIFIRRKRTKHPTKGSTTSAQPHHSANKTSMRPIIEPPSIPTQPSANHLVSTRNLVKGLQMPLLGIQALLGHFETSFSSNSAILKQSLPDIVLNFLGMPLLPHYR
jgi:hypothetical protein